MRGASVAILRELDRFLARIPEMSDADWRRPTSCGGWTVLDLVRHHVPNPAFYAWIVESARKAVVPPLAEGRFDSASDAAEDLAQTMAAGRRVLRAVLESLTEADLDLVVRWRPDDEGRPLGRALANFLMEFGVHADDLLVALGVDEPVAADVAEAVGAYTTRNARGQAESAGAAYPDRGFRVMAPHVDVAFYVRGGVWRDGEDADVPTCLFGGDDDVVSRLLMGRIALTAEHARECGKPWDPRLRLSGETSFALELTRYCYGYW